MLKTGAPAARPPRYPQRYVEIDRSKGSMYGRVLTHNSEEEKTFHEVVEEANWTTDDDYKLGAHPVPVTTLVEERKAMLKTLITCFPRAGT